MRQKRRCGSSARTPPHVSQITICDPENECFEQSLRDSLLARFLVIRETSFLLSDTASSILFFTAAPAKGKRQNHGQ